jgi:hypothetical protein
MPKFNLNGTIYNIPDDVVNDFISDNPTAVLVEEEGKEIPTAPGAVVEENVAPESQDTELVSEDGLLDSQITNNYNIDGENVTKDEFDQYTALQEKGKFEELISDPNNPKLLEQYEKKEKQAKWDGRIASEKTKYDDIYGIKDEKGNLVTDSFGNVERRELSSLEKINNSLFQKKIKSLVFIVYFKHN